jgi:C-terminal processing protease CtpA/Prc
MSISLHFVRHWCRASDVDRWAFLDRMKMRMIVSVTILTAGLTLLAEELGGTGVWIADRRSADEPLRTVQVWPGSPADKAGIKPGWFLISVDGTNVVSMPLTNAMSMLRGPVGKAVTLEVTDPSGSQTNKFTVKRGRIVIENNRVVAITDP